MPPAPQAPSVLVDRPQPEWPLARLLHLLYVNTGNRREHSRAADIPELADGWCALFRRRLDAGVIEFWRRRRAALAMGKLSARSVAVTRYALVRRTPERRLEPIAA